MEPSVSASASWRRIALAHVVGVLLGFDPAAAQDSEIRFLAPRHLATAIGRTPVVVEVDAPQELSLLRVEIRVDGELIATLRKAPFRVDWDAGDGTRGHSLNATVIFADQSSASAAVRTSALRINQIEEVDLVTLYPIVRRGNQGYVSGLKRDDFEIREDEVLQSISRFSTERVPLRVAIALDTSQSMEQGTRLEDAQEAAIGFLDVLEKGDVGLVVTFDDSVRMPTEPVSNRKSLLDAIKGAQARGGTALYDAIWRASRRLADFRGRRVLVVLSDGRDESYDGLEQGSLHTLDEALDQALRNEVMIFAIGLGRSLDELDHERKRPLSEILLQMSESTGGRAFFSSRSGKLRRSFRSVAEDLRNQYSIGFVSTNPSRDGRRRRLEVRIPGRDLEVISRKSYYAPE